MRFAFHQIAKPPDARTNEANLATYVSSTSSSHNSDTSFPPNACSIAAIIGGSAWHVMTGSRRAAATSPDRSFCSIALPSASACALLSPSPSLVCQCLQPTVSCGHRVVIIFTSTGHFEIDARKYTPSGPAGFRPYTSMPISPALRQSDDRSRFADCVRMWSENHFPFPQVISRASLGTCGVPQGTFAEYGANRLCRKSAASYCIRQDR
jgi:hypothetical protein